MDPNKLLQEILQSIETVRILKDDPEDCARELADQVEQLHSHLAAGGTPPEAWREGPDEPYMDGQTCGNCGDDVLTVSSRGWCDGCEEEAAAWQPAPEGGRAYQLTEGPHGSVEWQRSEQGIPAEALPLAVLPTLDAVEDVALGNLHMRNVEVWAVEQVAGRNPTALFLVQS